MAFDCRDCGKKYQSPAHMYIDMNFNEVLHCADCALKAKLINEKTYAEIMIEDIREQKIASEVQDEYMKEQKREQEIAASELNKLT